MPVLKAQEKRDAFVPPAEASATADSPKLPDILNWHQLRKTALIEPQMQIDGLLHKGDKMLLGGGSKSFKTWTLLDLGICIATGREWLGRACKPAKVLYINFELKPFWIRHRINEIMKARKMDIADDSLQVWNLRSECYDWEVLQTAMEIDEVRPDVLIVDPVYKTYGQADENSAGDVGGLLNRMEQFAKGCGDASLIFGHHFSKGNQAAKESIDRVSGSGVWARDPDSLIIMTRHEEKDCFTVDCTLRNLPAPDPFVVRFDFPLFRVDGELLPGKLHDQTKKSEVYGDELFLAALTDEGIDERKWTTFMAEKVGCSERTASMKKVALLKSGKIKIHGISSSAKLYKIK